MKHLLKKTVFDNILLKSAALILVISLFISNFNSLIMTVQGIIGDDTLVETIDFGPEYGNRGSGNPEWQYMCNEAKWVSIAEFNGDYAVRFGNEINQYHDANRYFMLTDDIYSSTVEAGKTYKIDFELILPDGINIDSRAITFRFGDDVWDSSNVGFVDAGNAEQYAKGSTNLNNGYIRYQMSVNVTTPELNHWESAGVENKNIMMRIYPLESTDTAVFYVDNVNIYKKGTAVLTIHNYDGADKKIDVTADTKFGDIVIPERSGFVFNGLYLDASLTEEVDYSELAQNVSEIWAKWDTKLVVNRNTYDDDAEYYQTNSNISKSELKRKAGGSEDSVGQFGVEIADTENIFGEPTKALKFSIANQWKYNWPTAIKIYDSNTYKATAFKTEKYKKYQITFKYNITDWGDNNNKVELILRQGAVNNNSGGKDILRLLAGENSLDKNTERNVWMTYTGLFTASDIADLYITATTNASGQPNDNWGIEIGILIDDLVISEIGTVACHSYDGRDKDLEITADTKFSDLPVPERDGYIFCGFFLDEDMSAKAVETNYVSDVKEIWAKWVVKVNENINSYDDGAIYEQSKPSISQSELYRKIGDSSSLVGQFGVDIAEVSDESGNPTNAINILKASQWKYNWPTAVKIYDSNSGKASDFKTQKNKKYQIELKYRVDGWDENNSNDVELILRQGEINNNSGGSVLLRITGEQSPNLNKNTERNKWMSYTGSFIAEQDSVLYITATTNASNDDTNISWAIDVNILIDDIIITEYEDIEYEHETEDGIWTGVVAGKFSNGSGTQEDPYIISDGAELAYAVKYKGLNGSYFKLSKDIYLNRVDTAYWYKNGDNNTWFGASLSTSDGFNGHIDGNGHIVYGLWYPDSETSDFTGLIPNFYSGSIEKIGVRYAYINAGGAAGGIIGVTVSGGVKTIDQCFADNTVQVAFTKTTADGGLGAGGIIGYTSNEDWGGEQVKISNCYSKAGLSGYNEERTNGIIGTSWRSAYSMKNCYSIGYAPFFGARDGTISSLHIKYQTENVVNPIDAVYQNVYTNDREPWGYEQRNGVKSFTNIPSLSDLSGEAARNSMPGLDYENVFEIIDSYTPKLKIFTQIDGSDSPDGVSVTGFASGDGTKKNPYIIETADHLRNLVTSTSTKGNYYELANDIYINDTTDPDWMNKNPEYWYYGDWAARFQGYLEGNGHEIHGIYYNQAPAPSDTQFEYSAAGGLFGWIVGGSTVRNVHIRDSYISVEQYAGAIAGLVVGDGYANVIGCSADETVAVKGWAAGGLIGGGARGLNLSYSYSLADVEASSEMRGNSLVGDIWSSDYQLAQCYGVNQKNFRDMFIPAVSEAVYGNIPQNGVIVLDISQMTGSAAKKNMTEFDWNIWIVRENKTPHVKVISEKEDYIFNLNGEKGKPWSGKAATDYAGGSGTENDPYLIETPEQLAKCILSSDFSEGLHFKLTADIILNDTSYNGWQGDAKNWYAGRYNFGGHFDGDGHIVSGLFYNITDGSAMYAGLFPWITANSIIENVGVVNSSITITGGDDVETFAGAITGYIHGWFRNGYFDDSDNSPLIRQCFADHTVSVKAMFAGGLIGGVPAPVDVENCYFTGKITGSERAGGLMGSHWANAADMRSYVKNCYFATEDRDRVADGPGVWSTTFENTFVDGPHLRYNTVVQYSIILMQGNLAKQYLTGFDFNNVWKTVEGGTPVLRIFNSDRYTCKREATEVEIAFVVNGGEELEPIKGYPRITKVNLPTPTRYGYEFGGWYHYSELDVPVTYEYFPDYNIYVYAKWIPKGFIVDYEEAPLDEKYDYNSACEYYRPGVKGYNTSNVHGGLRSMHCKADTENSPTFLLSYENKLEVGTEYEFNVWMSSESSDASGVIEFVYSEIPDINAPMLGYEKGIEFTGLKAGEWKQYKVVFTAGAPYLFIKTPKDTGLYFDDLHIVPTGNSGNLGNITLFEQQAVEKEPITEKTGYAWIFIVGAGVLVVLAAAFTVVILKTRRKSK